MSAASDPVRNLEQRPSARLTKGSFNGTGEFGILGRNGRLVSTHDCTVPANQKLLEIPRHLARWCG